MMDAATIRQIARDAASRARKARREPMIVEAEDKADWTQQIANGVIPDALRHIPNLGDYRPKGWRLLDYVLVDKSGLGHEDEPALTLRGFVAWLTPGFGYAMIEEGQFQVVIGRFQSPRERNDRHEL